MALTYGGSLTLGQVVPMAQTAVATLDASLTPIQGDVQARVTGLLALSVAPPPSLATLIANAQALLDALSSLASAPLPDVSATADALAELQATLAGISAGLAFSASLGSLLATAGIHYYVYAGRADEVGGELAAALSAGLPGGGGPGEQIAGAILLASDGDAIEALQSFFSS